MNKKLEKKFDEEFPPLGPFGVTLRRKIKSFIDENYIAKNVEYIRRKDCVPKFYTKEQILVWLNEAHEKQISADEYIMDKLNKKDDNIS